MRSQTHICMAQRNGIQKFKRLICGKYEELWAVQRATSKIARATISNFNVIFSEDCDTPYSTLTSSRKWWLLLCRPSSFVYIDLLPKAACHFRCLVHMWLLIFSQATQTYTDTLARPIYDMTLSFSAAIFGNVYFSGLFWLMLTRDSFELSGEVKNCNHKFSIQIISILSSHNSILHQTNKLTQLAHWVYYLELTLSPLCICFRFFDGDWYHFCRQNVFRSQCLGFQRIKRKSKWYTNDRGSDLYSLRARKLNKTQKIEFNLWFILNGKCQQNGWSLCAITHNNKVNSHQRKQTANKNDKKQK